MSVLFRNFIRLLESFVPLAIAGVIGNLTYAGFLYVLFKAIDLGPLRVWIVIVTVVIPFVPAFIIIYKLYRAHQLSTRLNELDDTLLRLLSQLGTPTIHDEADNSIELKRVIKEFLQGVLSIFPAGCRASILLPNRLRPHYLTIWEHCQMPSETVQRTEFYIADENGSTDVNRGIAGRTHRDQKIRVVNFFKKNGRWSPDDRDYIIFDNKAEPSYRSLVVVPVIGNDSQSIGVLCIDSWYAKVFDSFNIQNLLQAVAQRLAAGFIISEKLNRQ